jgi:GNAT superfamily N-acetyltransferase
MRFEEITYQDLALLGPLQPADWGDIVPAFRFYLESPFCFPVKTTVDDAIAGIGAAIILEGTAWLAHIIVSPDHRKQGIGSAVTGHLLDITREQRCKTVSLIATELGYPIYKKAGFAEQDDYVFFKRETPLENGRLTEDMSYYREGFKTGMLKLDRAFSGESRAKLLEPKLEHSLVHQNGGKVDGFYLPGLGEGLIIAANVRAGLELLRLKLSLTNKNVLPASNKEGMALMLENGFLETKRAKRMVWGPGFAWHPEKMFGRIAGNLG